MSSVKLAGKHVAIRLLQMSAELVEQFKLDDNEIDSKELSSLKKLVNDSEDLSFNQVLKELAGPFSAFDLISSGILQVLTQKMENSDSGNDSDSENTQTDPTIIKTLVKIVEACEKIPVYQFCSDNTITPIQKLENLRSVFNLTLKKTDEFTFRE